MAPNFEAFYDQATGTVSYVVYDEVGGHAAVIDPVLGYEARSGRSNTQEADRILGFLVQNELVLQWILETHVHADHLSAAHYLKTQAGGSCAIGANTPRVQSLFKNLFNLGPDFRLDGSQFDHLLSANETFCIGKLSAQTLFVPGHTLADVAYLIGDLVFVGDTLFMPDLGTARCDFPGGDARVFYRSVRRLLALPDETRLLLCHDYPPPGRAPAWQSTVGEQRRSNIHIHDGVDEEAFVAMRTARDATLDLPLLILPAVQVNIRAGAMPAAESNGIAYLKIPLNGL
jgi:glyoxylase-like metal-dependent hydrolase (beta-lactamase superfamily II)